MMRQKLPIYLLQSHIYSRPTFLDIKRRVQLRSHENPNIENSEPVFVKLILQIVIDILLDRAGRVVVIQTIHVHPTPKRLGYFEQVVILLSGVRLRPDDVDPAYSQQNQGHCSQFGHRWSGESDEAHGGSMRSDFNTWHVLSNPLRVFAGLCARPSPGASRMQLEKSRDFRLFRVFGG